MGLRVYAIFKVPRISVELKYRSSLLHSTEEKNIRTLRLGIHNGDEAIIKLSCMALVDIIVNA